MFPAVRITSVTRAAVLALLLVHGARPAHAVDYFWGWPISGSAGDPARWAPSGVPDPSSQLAYNKLGAYAVSFPGTVPRTRSQTVTAGDVTLQPLGLHLLEMLFCSGGSTTLSGGSIAGSSPSGTYFELSNTTLMLTNGAHLSGRGYVGLNGPAELRVLEGSQLHTVEGIDIRRNGIVGVYGWSGTPKVFSGLDAKQGVTVSGHLWASEGGFVDAQGTIYVTGGTSPASVQSIYVGDGSYLKAHSELLLGDPFTPGPTVGKPQFEIHGRAWAHVAGITQVGDPAGDDGSALRVFDDATFTASGGLEVYSTAGTGLDLQGGITHVRGGEFLWPANKLLTISSHTGTPELWISNGATNVGPNSGSPFNTALLVGKGGAGTLRVTRYPTVLPVTGSATVGDSTGSVGVVVVDSLATIPITGTLVVGSSGTGDLRVRNGSQVSAGRLLVGAAPGGTGRVQVSGSATILSAIDAVDIGGSSGTPGGAGTVVIDSSAAMFVTSSSANPALVTIHAASGKLVVAHQGILHTGALEDRGELELWGGSISAQSASVLASGRVSGSGTIGASVFTNGSFIPGSATDDIGRIAVNHYSQFSLGRYQVHLGAGRRSDTLAVSGTANLDGALEISLTPDFVRTPGDTFTIMTYSARNGTFSSVTLNGNPVLQQIQLLYEPKAVRVLIPEAALGVGDESQALHFAPAGGPKRLAFELDLPAPAEVNVAVYDVAGREVATLADGPLGAGRHVLGVGAGRELASGMYFARATVRTAGRSIERVAKAILLR